MRAYIPKSRYMCRQSTACTLLARCGMHATWISTVWSRNTNTCLVACMKKKDKNTRISQAGLMMSLILIEHAQKALTLCIAYRGYCVELEICSLSHIFQNVVSAWKSEKKRHAPHLTYMMRHLMFLPCAWEVPGPSKMQLKLSRHEVPKKNKEGTKPFQDEIPTHRNETRAFQRALPPSAMSTGTAQRPRVRDARLGEADLPWCWSKPCQLVNPCGWSLRMAAAWPGGAGWRLAWHPFAMIRKTAGDHLDFQRSSAKIQADLNSFNNRTRESSDLWTASSRGGWAKHGRSHSWCPWCGLGLLKISGHGFQFWDFWLESTSDNFCPLSSKIDSKWMDGLLRCGIQACRHAHTRTSPLDTAWWK